MGEADVLGVGEQEELVVLVSALLSINCKVLWCAGIFPKASVQLLTGGSKPRGHRLTRLGGVRFLWLGWPQGQVRQVRTGLLARA